MPFIDFIVDKFNAHASSPAFIMGGEEFSYRDLSCRLKEARALLDKYQISSGMVICLHGNFTPMTTALLLALIERAAIIVPIAQGTVNDLAELRKTALIEVVFTVDESDNVSMTSYSAAGGHHLFGVLRKRGHPGLILFSSGSTGVKKASITDFVSLLEKFKHPRKAKRMLTFLLFDHIGGLNTLFYNLANGGVTIAIGSHSMMDVLGAVERHRVEVLPVSPTFLNLLLLSEEYKNYDLSSLHTISYGTEIMPKSTLNRLHAIFPNVRLLQTYGLSEVGILETRSRGSDSLWMKVGGEGFETRVVDGMLEIKAQSMMLGYLNAPSPFSDDGWFRTMDMVVQDGEFLQILGRKSEIINVGGQKVYPGEVESALLEMDGVVDVVVRGEKNALTGNIVTATFVLKDNMDSASFRTKVRKFCKGHIADYMIPMKVMVSNNPLESDRFKKKRS